MSEVDAQTDKAVEHKSCRQSGAYRSPFNKKSSVHVCRNT